MVELPIKSIAVFEFEMPRLAVVDSAGCGDESRMSELVNATGTSASPLAWRGLVAITADSALIYVSGHMYLHSIWAMYFAEGLSEARMHDYIQTRYFNYMPTDVRVDTVSQSVTFPSLPIMSETVVRR